VRRPSLRSPVADDKFDLVTHVADSTSLLLASYEALPYQGHAIPPTHPDSLASAARLRGIDTPDVTSCRVLDLGCATGENIISMALSLPGSSFVGVDLSPRQIDAARETARLLGLDNVHFEAMSIADIDDRFGAFDYIVSHGVYSWVPSDVQSALLGVCARNLAPDGIAYVSYNTYPGWHLRGLMRDMLLFHDRIELPPSERVTRGRELVEFLAKSVLPSEQVYGALLQEEFTLLTEASDTYFLHEQLEAVNHPVYFREFAARAQAAGLRFVGEAQLSAWDAQLTDATRGVIKAWAKDDVSYEQYLDFLRGRSFRRSLLCRADVSVDAEVSPAAVASLYLSARCAPDPSAPEAQQPGVEVFRTPKGLAVTLNHPMLRAALHALIDAAPARLSFDDLCARTRHRLDGSESMGFASEMLADAMLRSSLLHLVGLHVVPAACATSLPPRPVANPLARLQARTSGLVASFTNQNLKLSNFDRFIVSHTDGTRDRDALVNLTADALVRGELTLEGAASPTRDELSAAVSFSLRQFLLNGLLAR